MAEAAQAGIVSTFAVPEGRGYQLLLLTVALTVAVYTKAAINPIQETMRVAMGLTDNQIALLQGPTMAIPMLVAAVPLGLIVDRYSRVRLLYILLLLNVLGSVATAFATSFGMLLAARGVVGFAAFALYPVGFSLLADLYAPTQRGRATMWLTMGQFAGVAAVFALGGMLLTMAMGGIEPWRWAMLWLTAPLVIAIILMPGLREPKRTGRDLVNPSPRDSLGEFWRYRGTIVPPLLGMVTAEIALGSVMIWSAPALTRSFSLQPDRVGAIMASAVLVSGVVGTAVGGLLADQCQRTGGPRRTITILSSLALLSAPAGLFAVMSSLTLASVFLLLLIATLTAILVIGTTLFTVVIPNELRGLCIGVQTAIGAFLGVGLSPLIVSVLSGQLGGTAMMGKALTIVCVSASLLCACIFVTGRRFLPGHGPRLDD